MALPALIKAWEAEFPLPAQGRSSALLDLKDALVNHPTHPWSVIGSCDRSTSGMDAVDRWIIPGDVQGSPGPGPGAISWIVLEQPSMGGPDALQLLIYLDDSELINDPDGDLVHFHYSPAVGYGLAVGGTDGATTAPPTSTESRSTGGGGWLGGDNVGAKLRNIISATDGTSWRIIMSDEASGLPVSCLGIETVQNPVAGWTAPRVGWYVATTVAGGLNCFRREVMQEAEFCHVILPGDAGNFNTSLRMVGPMFGSVEVVDNLQDDGRVIFYPGDLFNDAVGAPGKYVGQLPDLYWASRNPGGGHAADLDTFPANGDRTFVCLGDVVAGWVDDGITELLYNGAPAPPLPAAVPAVFVSSSTANADSASPQITIPAPAGIQDGDLLIAFILSAGDASGQVQTRPAGWVSKHAATQNLDGSPAFEDCDILTASGSEPGSYTWTFNGPNASALGTIVAYRPAHANQLDVNAGAAMGSGAVLHTAPNVTTIYEQSLIVAGYMFNRIGSNNTNVVVPPAGMTQRANITGSGISRGDLGVRVYDESGPAQPGLYSGKQLQVNQSTDGYGITAAIRALNAQHVAPVFVAASTVVNPEIGATVTVPVPLGTVDGDVMIMVILGEAASQTSPATPPGWTLVSKQNMALQGTITYHHVLYRIASSEPASYAIAMLDNFDGVELAACLTYRPGSATQLEIFSNAATGTNTATHTLPDATTTHAQTMMLSYFGLRRAAAAVSSVVTPPAGTTGRVDINGSGESMPDLQMAIYEEVLPAGGLYSGKSLTSQPNTDGAGFTIGIRAANT